MRQAAERKIVDPEWAPMIMLTLERLNCGFYDQEYVDVVMQPHAMNQDSWDIYDAFAFMKCTPYFHKPHGVYEFEIGVTPERDRFRKENQSALDQIAGPASATVAPQSHGVVTGDDGFFEFKETPHWFDQSRSTIPLEIGATNASTTYFHLVCNGGVARWPYGRDYITAVYVNPQQVNNDFSQPASYRRLQSTLF